MFEIREARLKGCFEIIGKTFSDERGDFRKLYAHAPFKQIVGENFRFREFFTSSSKANVVRGLHFQSPPMDHMKLVCSLKGKVIDVAVDLRKNSPTYGQHQAFELSEERQNMILLGRGFAHGFYSLEPTLMFYAVETDHSAEHDKGIHWNSLGIKWPLINGTPPIVSSRDSGLPAFKDFISPF